MEKQLKLKENLRINKLNSDAILYDPETDYVYEISEDIICFIERFDGVLSVSQIITATRNEYNLQLNQINQLIELVDELVSEKILIECS
jgi:hypothetical protein